MALEAVITKEAILKEIFKLNNSGCNYKDGYKSYDKNDSCREIRQEAANLIEGVIKEYHKNYLKTKKNPIAPPDEDLVRTLKRIAKSSKDDEYSVKYTWFAASCIIDEHILRANASESTRNQAYLSMQRYLENEYLPGSSFTDSRTFLFA